MDAATGKRTAFGLEGDTEIVSARERGRSGSATGGLGAGGGQGESELQLQRRRITDRRKLLLRRLEEVGGGWGWVGVLGMPAAQLGWQAAVGWRRRRRLNATGHPACPALLLPVCRPMPPPSTVSVVPAGLQVRKTRAVQRAARRRSGKPQVWVLAMRRPGAALRSWAAFCKSM